MSKKRNIKVEAAATAKLEASAKALFERKKNVIETIPPDVTRAKASAWLDLISPITEWAGLKGDALKFQRQQLRIQQEESLFAIAQSVRQKIAGKEVVKPVPRKILVPALEKASLEEAEDETMVEFWANLLASAAQAITVQPRFVGILAELAGAQAKCLDRVAFENSADSIFPAAEFENSYSEFARYNIQDLFKDAVTDVFLGRGGATVALDLLVDAFKNAGVLLELGVIIAEGRFYTHDIVEETGIHDDENLAILESLGLVRFEVISFLIRPEGDTSTFEVSAYYYHLTRLGVEFCKVCSRPRVDELAKIDAASQKKGLKRRGPFEWDTS